MSNGYDSWLAHNPRDEELGPLLEACPFCGAIVSLDERCECDVLDEYEYKSGNIVPQPSGW